MKLLKNAIFGIILVFPMFVFSGNAQAGNIVLPVSVQWYDWDSGPGVDADWRVIFHNPYASDSSNFYKIMLTN